MWSPLHTFTVLWGSLAFGAKGIETKTVQGGGGRSDIFPPYDSISLKTSPNKWLRGINLIKHFLQTIECHHLLFVYECTPRLFFFPLYLTQRELMELLWWWCMGDCARRQMGKCNYGCFRASGRGGKKKKRKNLSQRRVQETKTAPFVMWDNSQNKIKSRDFYIKRFLLKLCFTPSTQQYFFIILEAVT